MVLFQDVALSVSTIKEPVVSTLEGSLITVEDIRPVDGTSVGGWEIEHSPAKMCVL